MTVATLLTSLNNYGYKVSLTDDGEHIRLKHIGAGSPPVEAKPLIDELRTRRAEALEYLREQLPKPYLDDSGELVIPFGADPRYRWWQRGRQPSETEREVREWVH